MFRYDISQGYLSENPIKQTKKYPIPNKGGIANFTDQELERIWEELTKNKTLRLRSELDLGNVKCLS